MFSVCISVGYSAGRGLSSDIQWHAGSTVPSTCCM